MNCLIKYALHIILCIAIIESGYSQCENIIVNWSFENAALDINNNYPNEPHQIYQVNIGSNDEYMQAWRTDQYENNNGTKWVHSPDWFKSHISNAFHVMKEKYDGSGTYYSYYTTAYAHSGGIGYIGMSDAELVQQNLNDNLEEGKTYTIEMFIRPVFKTWEMDVFNGYYKDAYDWNGGAKFRAWIAKDKIKYQNNDFNDDCKDNYDLFSTPLTDKIEILNLNLNLTDFEVNNVQILGEGVYKWKKIFADFTAPDIDIGEENYNWLIIELAGNNTDDPCNVYLLIDDVSLKQGCTVECSRTDGCMVPYVRALKCGLDVGPGSPIRSYQILKISNLENAKKVDMVVRTSNTPNAQIVFTKTFTCDNGINGPVYWDGRNNNGAPLATAWYYITLIRENSCGTDVFDWDTDGFNSAIYILEPYSTSNSECPLIFTDFTCNEYNLITPTACCAEQPDIYLDELSIGNPGSAGSLEYIAVNNIYLGPNLIIESDANVLFRAGEEIIGAAFEEVEIGATVVAEIIPCPAQRLANPYYDSYSGEEASLINNFNPEIPQNTIEDISDGVASKNGNIQIIPNPSGNGVFSIWGLQSTISDFISAQSGSIAIYNILGETIYQMPAMLNSFGSAQQTPISIDISTYPKGIYFIKLNNGVETSLQKIIYQ